MLYPATWSELISPSETLMTKRGSTFSDLSALDIDRKARTRPESVDPHDHLAATVLLTTIAQNAEDVTSLQRLCKQGRRLGVELRDSRSTAFFLCLSAAVRHYLGNYQMAAVYGERALREILTLNVPADEMRVKALLSSSYSQLSLNDEAHACRADVVQLSGGIHNPMVVAHISNSLAADLLREGDVVAARRFVEHGLLLVQYMVGYRGRRHLLSTAADVAIAQNRLDAAEAMLAEISHLQEVFPSRLFDATILITRSNLLAARHDHMAAAGVLAGVADRFSAMGLFHRAETVAMLETQALVAAGDLQGAHRALCSYEKMRKGHAQTRALAEGRFLKRYRSCSQAHDNAKKLKAENLSLNLQLLDTRISAPRNSHDATDATVGTCVSCTPGELIARLDDSLAARESACAVFALHFSQRQHPDHVGNFWRLVKAGLPEVKFGLAPDMTTLVLFFLPMGTRRAQRAIAAIHNLTAMTAENGGSPERPTKLSLSAVLVARDARASAVQILAKLEEDVTTKQYLDDTSPARIVRVRSKHLVCRSENHPSASPRYTPVNIGSAYPLTLS